MYFVHNNNFKLEVWPWILILKMFTWYIARKNIQLLYFCLFITVTHKFLKNPLMKIHLMKSTSHYLRLYAELRVRFVYKLRRPAIPKTFHFCSQTVYLNENYLLCYLHWIFGFGHNTSITAWYLMLFSKTLSKLIVGKIMIFYKFLWILYHTLLYYYSKCRKSRQRLVNP